MDLIRKRNFLTMKEFSTEEIRQILDIAKNMKANSSQYSNALKGKELAMLFQKTSTRTRVSFEVGMDQLGGHAIFLDWQTTNFTLAALDDETKVLSRYVQAIMARVYPQKDLETIAQAASVPVINGLSDDYHPVQALADLLTIEEKLGSFSGITVAYVGDGSNNTSNSLIIACVKFGIPLHMVRTQNILQDPLLRIGLKNKVLKI